MSWSVNVDKGSKEDVAKLAAMQFDAAAKFYEGTEEGKDIQAAKARALVLIGKMAPAEGEGVYVKAYGSHTTGNDVLRSAGFRVDVSVDRIIE